MASGSTYTVKGGDTLNSIAQGLGYKSYQEANISGFSNPDKIQVGQVLNIGGGPKTQVVPGVGTLTVTPKGIPSAPATSAAPPEDLTGAYTRAGLTAPAKEMSVEEYQRATGTGGYNPPAVAGLPSYPSGTDSAARVKGITDSYTTTLDQITKLETAISAATVASPEEKALQKQLADAKSHLASFDLGTLSAEEGLRGQGRGATLGTIDTRTTVLDRTRALERLGLAQEADTLTTQLGLAQDNRKNMGDLATTQYNLATKKLDIALGISDKIDKINQDDRDNARQFLLDTVSFADGKSYDELTPDTQAAITHAVANSPITLNMVQTALASGKEKAAAAKMGNLRSVAGLGVVQINADGSYKVIVPENTSPSPAANVPTFAEYVTNQGLPFGVLAPATMDKLKAEYDAKYAGASVSLGKLTPTNKSDLSQAGLSAAPTAVQSYFLNAPAEFRDSWNRDVASGKVTGAPSLSAITGAYTAWYNAKNNGGHDWASLLQ